MTVVGDAYPYQIKPDELYGILQPQFQARAEPNFAWKSAVSALMYLPASRAAWPLSALGDAAADLVRDVSGNGNHLTNPALGRVRFGTDGLAPYGSFVDTDSDYLYRVDGTWADILGTETYVVSAERGLTLGGWFLFDKPTVAADIGLMGKWEQTAGNQRSYLLYHESVDDTVYFKISSSGANAATTPGSVIPTASAWHCIFGRYEGSSTDISCFVNGTWYTAANTTFAAINNSTADFQVGAFDAAAAGTFFDGKMSLLSLNACYISDSIVAQFYHQTRSMFGV